MKRLLLALAASVLCFSCSQEGLTTSNTAISSGPSVTVRKADESSELINIYTITVVPDGESNINFGFGNSGVAIRPEESFDILMVASLKEIIPTPDSTEDRFAVEVSQYSEWGFFSNVSSLSDIENLRNVSVEDYIDGFDIKELELIEGETVVLGSINGREFEISEKKE